MEWHALIEEWPNESLVSFRELPGCLSVASTAEQATQNAPEAITEYLRWLRQNNIYFLEDEIDSTTFVVQERVRADHVGVLFKADLVAPTEQEMTNALSVAATARAQLAELYNDVSPAQRICALEPGEWSLMEHLQHVIRADAYYVDSLTDQRPPEVVLPATEAELPRALIENGMTHDTFLREMTAPQRARVYRHGEGEWTAAKVVRRMTEHLRDHFPTMQTIARQIRTSQSG
jgi:predicted RNase H-like HicB family nuclease/uncharacterized damage-inducible protein DinB